MDSVWKSERGKENIVIEYWNNVSIWFFVEVMYKMSSSKYHSNPNHPDQPKTGKRVDDRKRTLKIKFMDKSFSHILDPNKRQLLQEKLRFELNLINKDVLNIDRTLGLYAEYDNDRPLKITSETIRMTLIFQEGVAIMKELDRIHKEFERYPIPHHNIKKLSVGLLLKNPSDVRKAIKEIKKIRRFSKNLSEEFVSASRLSDDITIMSKLLLLEPSQAFAQAPVAPSGAAAASRPPPPSGVAATREPGAAAAREPSSGAAAAASRVAEARAKSSDSNIQTVLNALWFAAKHIYNPKNFVRNVVGFTVFTCALWGASAYHGSNSNTGHALGVLARTAEHASILYTGPANYVIDVAKSSAATAIETRFCNQHVSNGLKAVFASALWAEEIKQAPRDLWSSFQIGFGGSELPMDELYLLPSPQNSGFLPAPSQKHVGNLRGKPSAAVETSSSEKSMQLDIPPLRFINPSGNWVDYVNYMLPQEEQFFGACVAQAKDEVSLTRQSSQVSEEARSSAFHAGASVRSLLVSVANSARLGGEHAESAVVVATTVGETLARFSDMFIAILEMVTDIIPEIASTFAGGGSRQNKITRKYKNVISRGTKRTHRRTQHTNWRTTRKLLV